MILDDKLMKYVLFQKRTVQEVKNKCKLLGYTEDYIEEIIAYLIENGYLDDELYVMKFILNTIKLKKKSAKEIRFDLIRRGVNESVIDKYMDTSEINDYELRCAIELAQKKYKECNDILKVKKYLLNKGYRTMFVNKAIDTLKEISNNNNIEIYDND
ncbi:MAG: regulatory protein RecX [Clostridia bacterium]|nr:regulatory protein RecX [Clostridia bacterium]